MIDPTEYIGYVKSLVIKRYHGSELEDLISVGYYALTKAALSYKDDKGACFKTYLTIKVIGEVQNYLRTQPNRYHRSVKGRANLINFSTKDSTDSNYDQSISGAETFYDIDFLLRKLRKEVMPNRKIEIALSYYLEDKSYKELASKYSLNDRSICRLIKEGRDLIKKEIDDTVLL